MYSPRSMSTVTLSSATVSASSPAASPLNVLVIPSSRMRGMLGSTGAASPAVALRFHQAIVPPKGLDGYGYLNVGLFSAVAHFVNEPEDGGVDINRRQKVSEFL